jgi:uncharacterized membrane protein (DUF106 family)
MAFSSFIIANPLLSIFGFSLLVTIFITILTFFLTDRQLMKAIKERQKVLREDMKKFRDNPEKMMELNKKMMEDLPHQMKQSMKVSLVTIIPLLLLFNWLRAIFAQTSLASAGWFGWPLWIWCYLVSSIVFSIVLRKIFKLD